MKRAAIVLMLVLAACGDASDVAGDDGVTTTTGPQTTSTTSPDSDNGSETTTTTVAATTTTTAVSGGILVIAAIDFDEGTYTLRNDVDAALDLSGYFACNRPSYVELPAATLDPGATLDISTGGLSLSADDGELGVYDSQSFSSTSAIQAYVQWGSDGHGRTGTAVDAGVWTAGDFVDNAGASIVSIGSNPISARDWTATP